MNLLSRGTATTFTNRLEKNMDVVLMLGGWAIISTIIGLLAARKNRNGWAWGLIGGFVFLPTLIALAFIQFLCPNCKKPITKQEWNERKCPRCGWMEATA